MVKPQEGLIKENFALIVIQLIPQDRVDVLFNEEWMLTLNKNAQVGTNDQVFTQDSSWDCGWSGPRWCPQWSGPRNWCSQLLELPRSPCGSFANGSANFER